MISYDILWTAIQSPFFGGGGGGGEVSVEVCILKILSNLFQVLPRPNHCTLLEPGYGERIVIFYSDQELASNSMDQHTYSLIASLEVVELDCVQFDYIHWVRLIGTTEWIRTLTQPHWYGFASALTTTPDWTFRIKSENFQHYSFKSKFK